MRSTKLLTHVFGVNFKILCKPEGSPTATKAAGLMVSASMLSDVDKGTKKLRQLGRINVHGIFLWIASTSDDEWRAPLVA